ncbi:cytochrome P450 [Aspergillus alliaceus]|uniref:Cytochrome P450 n=1 Tax=Petromyces alliaceus TaxID=209559 RepID=A0A5N7BZ52_PETAA|nr:cytochrome P450 [Aspergillus alliaceus]
MMLYQLHIVYAFYNLRLHPLRKYPGPWYFAASDLPLELCLKYGEVVRVGPNELSYINTLAWKDVYYHGKEDFISTADRVTHSGMRKASSHAFPDRALREQEHIIRRYANRMVSIINGSIHRMGPKSAKHNMVEVYNFTAFDMLTELTFGKSLHLLDDERYLTWMTAIFQGLKFMTVRGVMKKLSIVGRLSEQLVSRGLRLPSSSLTLIFSAKLVNERLQRTDNKIPDTRHFVLQRKEDVCLSIPEMHSNASGLMIGGAETVATNLSGLTYFLLREPAVLKRLMAEIRDIFQTDKEITLLNIARLEYFRGIYFGMNASLPCCCCWSAQDCPARRGKVCNDRITGKSTVCLSNHAANRSPSNFSGAEEYLLEGWLGSDNAFVTDRKDVFQPFSVGPR